ncbi:D-2-hydroxyacid dehydrogenase [Enterococcus sp. LJL90]
MKIVVLDGHVLNPGDLSWDNLKALGEVTIYERTAYVDAEISERIGDAELVLTNKTPINEQVLAAAPNLQYIGVLATGYNVVDTEAAKKRGIVVTNIPTYATEAVAQFTFALLLEIANQVGLHNQSVHAGEWTNSLDFSYTKHPLMELQGKVFGMIGFGHIARATAKIAHAFDMKVIFYNHRPKEFSEDWLTQVSLEDLYQQSDIISLHVPQNSDTEKMINGDSIKMMKDRVILLNTSRGGLVDEAAVAEALESGKLQAFAADVVSTEPIKADNPLLSAPNSYLTPHIAWQAVESRQRSMGIAVDNVKGFLEGHIKNQVN